jgi:hypothetical protein
VNDTFLATAFQMAELGMLFGVAPTGSSGSTRVVVVESPAVDVSLTTPPVPGGVSMACTASVICSSVQNTNVTPPLILLFPLSATCRIRLPSSLMPQ